ncbi:MAG TPA: hypothetical protein VFN26_11570 [Candidatus Acidoferrum sp.]|nr:hypothetical protein [Candidatus Acidoferrum sp.]
MNSQISFTDKHRPAQVKHPSEAKEGFLAGHFYRTKKIANFTREVFDFPNATVSISIGPSAGWVNQLAGITNVSVGVASGAHITGRISPTEIVGTGLFSEGTNRISFGQNAHLVTGLVEDFGSGYFGENAIYLNPDSITLLGNVQQITMVETVDAATLTQLAVTREYLLSAQLRRLRKLQAGWDGDRAEAISQLTGDTAEEIIKQVPQVMLSHLAIPTLNLGPLPDGSLRFECTHSNKELFLTISDKAVDVQAWQPLHAIESVGYWETDAGGAKEHLEWLVR